MAALYRFGQNAQNVYNKPEAVVKDGKHVDGQPVGASDLCRVKSETYTLNIVLYQ